MWRCCAKNGALPSLSFRPLTSHIHHHAQRDRQKVWEGEREGKAFSKGFPSHSPSPHISKKKSSVPKDGAFHE
jgi:hypothetical protein